MKNPDKPAKLLERLKSFELFESVDDESLKWLIEQSEYKCYPKGELIFHDGQQVEHMQVILSGGFVIRQEKDGRKREMGMFNAPYVTGVLPFSRMKEAGANGVCLADVETLELHRSCFVEMVNVSYSLTEALVSVMTNRVRDFQQMRLMDEKLMALGKMSAGLAHELNNPASAIVRGSRELHRHLQQTPERFKSVVTMRVSLDDVDAVNTVLFERIKARVDTEDLTLMEREDRRDDLLDWLEDHGIENGDEVVDTFVDWDFGTDHLQSIADVLPKEALEPVLWWVETNLTTEGLVEEIQTASSRISDLVTSIKTYSHMDQEPSMEATDINAGIKSTVTMLYHRIKKKKVQLKKELAPDLPKVKALGGELNQVWTNLIVNALDAMDDDGGQLHIRTFEERGCVCVEVEDNGPGIPEDIQSRVFEPFFTTKGIGEGTGMGLDIVRRVIQHHDGEVKLESKPGRTVFRTCFPTA